MDICNKIATKNHIKWKTTAFDFVPKTVSLKKGAYYVLMKRFLFKSVKIVINECVHYLPLDTNRTSAYERQKNNHFLYIRLRKRNNSLSLLRPFVLGFIILISDYQIISSKWNISHFAPHYQFTAKFLALLKYTQ